MKRKILLISLLFFASLLKAQQQGDYPVVGQPCPDFHFRDVHYYEKKEVSLSDFRGKWLILDLWNRHCSTCLQKMPVMDSLQRALAPKVQVLYVGYTGSEYTGTVSESAIKALYERVCANQNLKLAMAYDSTIFDRFNIGPCPYIIIVNPEGIVKGVTTRISKNAMDSLMAGYDVRLHQATRGNLPRRYLRERVK